MVIDLKNHGFRGNRFSGSTAEDLVNYAKSSLSEIASDKGVKARVVAEAMKSVTGVAPVVDTRDPSVTWVRTVPAHGEFIDAVFLKSAKQITAGPSKGRAADLKIDVMPALMPVLIRRVLPVALLIGAGLFAAGYYTGGK